MPILMIWPPVLDHMMDIKLCKWAWLDKKSKKCVRSGIRTHAYISRLRPERSALDRSAILTAGVFTISHCISCCLIDYLSLASPFLIL